MILEKGPKFNIHTKKRNWIQNLALEAKTVISKLPPTERDVYRNLTAERISNPLRNNSHTTQNTHSESRTIKSIQTKLKDNDTMIAQADKGNSLVVLPTKQYDAKIQNFIQANNFKTLSKDPTKNFQTQVRNSINKNPSAWTIKGLIKIHKPEHPI